MCITEIVSSISTTDFEGHNITMKGFGLASMCNVQIALCSSSGLGGAACCTRQ